jgi:hypothetical protein
MDGGKAIDSGGYGCIFRPSLKCDSSIKNNNENNSKYISKLLLNRHAEEEIYVINNIKPIILKIPKNDKYFLLNNTTYCKPDKLKETDLINLDKCDHNFEKANIDPNNINNELDRFKIINSLYGGIDLLKYVKSDKFTINNFKKLNNSIIELINNAVLPMNNLNILHLDLKDNNILYDNGELKIIDWGLSIIINNSNYKYEKSNFSNNLYGRPLQYNLPYSILILDKSFWDNLLNQLNYYKSVKKQYINRENLHIILKSILYNYFENNYERGHTKDIIQYDIPLIYNVKSDKFDKFIEIMYNIYTAIFDKYFDISKLKFRINDYIKHIYVNNCDVFGVLTIYLVILEKFKNNPNVDYNKLVNVIKKYIYEPTFYVKPYDIDEINKDLKELNSTLLIHSKSNKVTKKHHKQIHKKTKQKKI